MKKSLYILVAAALVMTGCSNDDYVGGPSHVENTTGNAIVFSGIKPNITRADAAGADAAGKLGNKFNVYGTKTFENTADDGTDDKLVNVFAQNEYAADANNPFWVWYNGNGGTTDSNEKGWEYVGEVDAINAGVGTLVAGEAAVAEQTIKYWDFAADHYDFIAYSATMPDKATVSAVQNDGFKVSATAKGYANLYIADYKPVTDANYNKTVTFMFRSAGTKVRLGIYETVPGYDVVNMNFRYTGGESKENAILDGSFIGSTDETDFVDADVTFAADGKAVVKFDPASAAVRKTFDFGKFDSATKLRETSANPTWASAELGTNGYIDVLPNVVAVADMTLYVDYELVNTVTNETIKVTGAKAVVPAQYMTWNPNYAYTYLFKISDNTNGTTGEEGTDPEGLYPITFDAVVAETVEDETQGTITTVSTPQITTYQDGSVSAAGIGYVNAAEPVYVTVSTDGALADLTTAEPANVALFTVPAGTTEAELVLGTVAETEMTAATIETPAEAATVNLVEFAAGKFAKFTPAAAGTYAFEYSYEGYKLTKDTEVATGKTYYTDAAGTDATGLTAGDPITTVLYEAATVKAYKVIVVVAPAPAE